MGARMEERFLPGLKTAATRGLRILQRLARAKLHFGETLTGSGRGRSGARSESSRNHGEPVARRDLQDDDLVTLWALWAANEPAVTESSAEPAKTWEDDLESARQLEGG